MECLHSLDSRGYFPSRRISLRYWLGRILLSLGSLLAALCSSLDWHSVVLGGILGKSIRDIYRYLQGFWGGWYRSCSWKKSPGRLLDCFCLLGQLISLITTWSRRAIFLSSSISMLSCIPWWWESLDMYMEQSQEVCLLIWTSSTWPSPTRLYPICRWDRSGFKEKIIIWP